MKYNSILYYQAKVLFLALSYSRKKTNSVGWGHGISRGIEERKCGNSRGQLKRKRNFQGCPSKTHVEFPWVLVFDLEISKGCHTNLLNFKEWKVVFSETSKASYKSKISRGTLNPLGVSENYIINPLCLFFVWNSLFLIGYSLLKDEVLAIVKFYNLKVMYLIS